MALDFPANPVDGEVYGSYAYSSTIGAWQAREESATVAVISPTKPLTANNGDIWYNTERGLTYIYYSDGTSSQWVEIVTSTNPEILNKADTSYVDSQDALKANLASPTFSGTVTLPSTTSIGNVSSTEIGYIDGVTSAVQTQLNAKANISGQSFTGSVSVPAIGINGVTSPTYQLEMIGRQKIRATSGDTAGIWMDNNAGNGQIFWGNTGLGAGATDATGIWHGGWKFYTTATLTTLINDTEIQRWRGHLDRSWDNYPSITIFNTTDKGPQGEFRLHGYPGSNGGDYSIVMRSDGGYVTGSDARRKVNIEQISNALSKINSISGKTFNIINSEGNVETELSSEETGKKFGFIAQEVADIIPEAVKYYPEADTPNENGYASAYSIDYGSIVPLLLQGINELTARVEYLESQINPGV